MLDKHVKSTVTNGPEALPEIADGAFYLAFFPAARGIAGTREEVLVASETQEPWQEANQAAIMFCDGCRQVVIDDFACHSPQCMEGMHVQRANVSKLWLCVNST